MSDTSSNSRNKLGRGSMYETPAHLFTDQMEILKSVRSLGLGFKKTTLDPQIYERLLDHFRSNIHRFKSEPSNGFIETENPRAFPSLLYQDDAFNQQLLSDLQPAHEAWSGLPIRRAACYGIRVYQPKSYLYNHVDRAGTHVVSSTVCVDHRLISPWPLYIEDNEGRPHEVSIEPGEMVFFEGARLKHGRPYPLEGEYYANIFIHYTPLDWHLTPQEPTR
jgi:prolyl 4-hydroxylase